MSKIKKYCEGLDCVICDEKEPCIYKIANDLQDQLKAKEQECEELKRLIAKKKNAKIQLSKLKDKQYKEFCDMKQILTEIKEIAEKRNYLDYNECLDDILQKISECEVNDEIYGK